MLVYLCAPTAPKIWREHVSWNANKCFGGPGCSKCRYSSGGCTANSFRKTICRLDVLSTIIPPGEQYILINLDKLASSRPELFL